jgi:hypothetical protein
VLATVINEDSRIAAAMMAAPINTGIELPARSGVFGRYP